MKRILIDSIHPEETRAILQDNNKIKEFEYESYNQKKLKGNIYLAKITRVEPSLQAAFVEYGIDQNGFLPFSEIHPDYYNIPEEDIKEIEKDNIEDNEQSQLENQDNNNEDENVEDLNNDDNDVDDIKKNASNKYSIQEVIKHNQLLQVQVVKEKRGNKGVSLTTYISIAGRYCIYMPKTQNSSGISRKIIETDERNVLKNIIDDFDRKNSGSIILRTAVSNKPIDEIVNDYEYLIRLWDKICENTLKATAPAFIHTEGNIVTRFIRDFFDNEVQEIYIEGEEAYNASKQLIQVMSPKDEPRLKLYKEKTPILQKFKIEDKINELYTSNVALKSGGYLVIDITEAMISIDINSGKSTSGRSIEETAFQTNLEAASEVARQIKIRNLSGLIVIDFIDMESVKNRIAIEKELRSACKNDKAKIQVGTISKFGLLEMSRQRLQPSLIELNTIACKHCNGKGLIISESITAVNILRAIEKSLQKTGYKEIHVFIHQEISLYLMNYKRETILKIENKYNVKILFFKNEDKGSNEFYIEKRKKVSFKETESDIPALTNPYSEYRDENSINVNLNKNRRSRKRQKVRNKQQQKSIINKLLTGIKKIIK